jgi:hypothetical protein
LCQPGRPCWCCYEHPESDGDEEPEHLADALLDEYLLFLRGRGPEPDLSGLLPDRQEEIRGQFTIVKALADRRPELPPLQQDPVAIRLGLTPREVGQELFDEHSESDGDKMGDEMGDETEVFGYHDVERAALGFILEDGIWPLFLEWFRKCQVSAASRAWLDAGPALGDVRCEYLEHSPDATLRALGTHIREGHEKVKD